jgi:hypothetical protein
VTSHHCIAVSKARGESGRGTAVIFGGASTGGGNCAARLKVARRAIARSVSVPADEQQALARKDLPAILNV